MSTSVNIVAVSRADAPVVADEEQIFELLSAVPGLEISAGLLMEAPEISVVGEVQGPAYQVYTAAAEYTRGSIEDARGAVGLLNGQHTLGFDVSLVPAELASDEKKILIMDVDSTLVQAEVIDELATVAGSGEQVSSITARAMAGELDFEESLRERVATLKGLNESVLGEVADRLLLSAGAQKLVEIFLAAGHEVCIVSGGFVQVLSPIAERLNLSKARANLLEVEGNLLTGRVSGRVVTAHLKRDSLREWAKEFGVKKQQVIAVGDGANDILMLNEAALGIAFNAKPALADVADAKLNLMRLDAVRHFVGL